jgi:hypothetical protein
VGALVRTGFIMEDVFAIPNTFEEATSLWDNLGATVAHAHLRRAQLVHSILHEQSNKFGRIWTAEDLGKEWGVTGERICRYVRTVKVFGGELAGLMDLPRISWTHLEEIARVDTPQARQDLLAAVQAEGLSSNETRHRVTAYLGKGAVAAGPISLPKLSVSGKNQVTGPMTFLRLMCLLTQWGSAATAEIRSIGTMIGPNGLFAASNTDEAHSSDALFELDALVAAVQDLRPLLINSLPAPEPKKPDLSPEESIPEILGGRTIDL